MTQPSRLATSLTPATRAARSTDFAAFMDTLNEEQAQALGNAWKTVLPALQQAATVLGTITIEITEADTADLPNDKWQRIETDWVDDPTGQITLVFPVVHTDRDGEYLSGNVFLARAEQRGHRRGLRAANALVREQAKIPVNLRGKVTFVFTGAAAECPSRNRGVAIVYWSGSGGRWVRGWLWVADDVWIRRCRPVSSRPPANSADR